MEREILQMTILFPAPTYFLKILLLPHHYSSFVIITVTRTNDNGLKNGVSVASYI